MCRCVVSIIATAATQQQQHHGIASLTLITCMYTGKFRNASSPLQHHKTQHHSTTLSHHLHPTLQHGWPSHARSMASSCSMRRIYSLRINSCNWRQCCRMRVSESMCARICTRMLFAFTCVDIKLITCIMHLAPPLGPNLYGLGEHVDPLRLSLDNHIYTLWNVDIPTPVDQNVYGAHPFFMQVLYGSGKIHVGTRLASGTTCCNRRMTLA